MADTLSWGNIWDMGSTMNDQKVQLDNKIMLYAGRIADTVAEQYGFDDPELIRALTQQITGFVLVMQQIIELEKEMEDDSTGTT